VAHSSEVLKTANQSINHLRAAESGVRGYIITHDPAFAETANSETPPRARARPRWSS
jgi:CHASE3 domain sensor protein